MPTIAEPTAQGYFRTVIRGECIRVRIHFEACKKVQKKNPWKNEIFTDAKGTKKQWKEQKDERHCRRAVSFFVFLPQIQVVVRLQWVMAEYWVKRQHEYLFVVLQVTNIIIFEDKVSS